MSVKHSDVSGGIIGVAFRFFTMKVCCVFSSESPHLGNSKVCCVFSLESPNQGDSKENTQYTIFNTREKLTLYCPKSAAIGFFPKTQEGA